VVEIYVRTTCPYCIRASRLLEQKGVAYEVYIVDFDSEKRMEMIQRAGGRTTVPQIFIRGSHVGGCDDLMRLDEHGKLDELLAA
jgi:glutaredoxin 3